MKIICVFLITWFAFCFQRYEISQENKLFPHVMIDLMINLWSNPWAVADFLRSLQEFNNLPPLDPPPPPRQHPRQRLPSAPPDTPQQPPQASPPCQRAPSAPSDSPLFTPITPPASPFSFSPLSSPLIPSLLLFPFSPTPSPT